MQKATSPETGQDPRHRSRFLRRDTPPHIITLILIAGLGALTMNIFLPSLPAMTTHFKTDYAIMQLAISAYLAMTAVFQLIIGPLSDRYGRRPVMIGGLLCFLAATICTLFAPNIELFLIARLLQATVVVGFVLSRAIVRDMVPTEQAASMIGYVTMGMTIVPMIGPTLGGYLEETFGWLASFYALVAVGILTLLIVLFDQQETNFHRSNSMTSQFRSYPELFGSQRFWGYSFTAMFASGVFFAFLGGAPYVARIHLELTPTALGLYFICIPLGYMSGNFLSGRYTTRFGLFTMMYAGAVVTCIGVLIVLGYFSMGYSSAIGFFGPLFFIGMGNGLTLPSANAGMVSVRPHLAGSASGLGGAIQVAGGAALSVLAGVMLTPQSGPAPVLWLMLIASLLGIAFITFTKWVNNKRRLDNENL